VICEELSVLLRLGWIYVAPRRWLGYSKQQMTAIDAEN
jgi:hypothetical protein